MTSISMAISNRRKSYGESEGMSKAALATYPSAETWWHLAAAAAAA